MTLFFHKKKCRAEDGVDKHYAIKTGRPAQLGVNFIAQVK